MKSIDASFELPFGSNLEYGRITLDPRDVMLIGLALYLIGYVLWIRKYRAGKQLVLLLLFMYIPALISYTHFPLLISSEMIDTCRVYCDQGLGLNLIPIKNTIMMYENMRLYNFLVNVVGNLMLLVPLGFIFPLIRKVDGRAVALIGLCFSLAIELSQLLLNIGYGFLVHWVDIDDVLYNTTGGIIGYGLYLLARKIIKMAVKADLSA